MSGPGDYKRRHRPPGPHFGFPLHAMDVGDDFYDHPEWYGGDHSDSAGDMLDVQGLYRRAIGNPDLPVTVYRAMPIGNDSLNDGDWVTLSPGYARGHIDSQAFPEDFHVVSATVPAGHVWSDGGDFNELGYWPQAKTAAVDPVEHGIDPDDYHFRRDLGRWRPRVGDDGMVDLYHRTSPSRADSIVAGGFDPSMGGSHPNETVFFSTSPEGAQGGHYGDAVVHVRVPAGDADFDTVWGEDSEEAWATVFPPDLRGLPARRLAAPWHSKAGDPSWPIPTGDLLRYRQFDPGVETPQDYHDSLYREEWSAGPAGKPVSGWGRRPSSDGFDTAGDEGSTEEELVEAFESGADLPPVEIVTNGKGAILSDGNHRVEVADTLSVPALNSHIWFDPQGDDDLYAAPLDMGSELGRRVDEVMQRYPFAPVDSKRGPDGSLPGRFVYRRRGDGRWERGTADDPVPRMVDDENYLSQMRALPDWAPGTFDDGVGHYWDVDFGDGPKPVHQRRLHARTAMPAVDAYDPDRRPAVAADPPVYPGPWYHGTDADLEGEAVLRPAGAGAGHPLGPGAENRRDWVWVTDNPWHAHAYGANVYEVRPGVEGPWPWNGDQGAGRFVSPSATVVRRLDREEWAYAKKYHGNGIHSPASEFYQRHAARGEAYDLDMQPKDGPDQTPPGPGPWFHGSPRRLRPGDIVDAVHDSPSGRRPYKGPTSPRDNWVWMSNSAEVSRGYGRYLYEVEPLDEGPWAYNESWIDGYVSPRARVVRVVPGKGRGSRPRDGIASGATDLYYDHAQRKPYEAARGDAYDAGHLKDLGGRPDQAPVLPGPWFHGSPAELQVGDLLDPTAPGNYEYEGERAPRDNWVFMDRDPRRARMWAGEARFQRQMPPESPLWVYRVEPMEEGPYPWNEYPDMGSVSPRARVVERRPAGDLGDWEDIRPRRRRRRPGDPPSLMERLEQAKAQAQSREAGFYADERRREYDERERAAADAGWAYDLDEPRDIAYKPVDWRRDPAPPPGDKWYHVSLGDLEPGTVLKPRGGPSAWGGRFQDWPRGRWTWMDTAEKAEWWDETGEGHVYEVAPSEPPRPWNNTGADGWVSPEARVVRKVRGPRYRTAGWSGDDAGRKVWRGVHLDPAMTDDEVAAALDADAGGWWTDFQDAAYSYGNTVVEGVHPGDAHVAEGHGGESGGWEYRFGPGTELEVRGVHRTRPHRDLPWQPRKLRVAGTRLHRGVGFGRGGLPPEVEQRLEAVLDGGDDQALGADLLRHLDRDGRGMGEYWGLDPMPADICGRQVDFRGPSDFQVSVSGEWDDAGHEQGDVDPHYRRLPAGSPVGADSVRVRRTPRGLRADEPGDGWVDLAGGGFPVHAALTEDVAARLQDEFDAWWAANGDDVPPYRLHDESRGPVGSWPYVEEFLRSEYPAAHRGLELGWEEAGALLDHPDRPLPYVSRPGGAGVAPYATGRAAVDEHGYDPAEIAAGMVLLHNRSMPSRVPIAGPEDEARLRDIAVKRHRMQGRRRVAISDLDAYDEWYDHEGPQETAQHEGPWYHYSPAELPPGTELVPGGGPSPWGDLYAGNDEMGDSEARRAYVWLSPDVSSAVGWAGETPDPSGGGGFIYRVEPSGDVYPWNDSGAEGWVADSATVVEALPRPWREAKVPRLALQPEHGVNTMPLPAGDWANLDPVWVPRRPRGRR